MRLYEEVFVAKAAKRASLKWMAAQKLSKKLRAEGVDAPSVHRAMEDLAEALRSR